MDNNIEQYYREQNITSLSFFDPESALFCHVVRHITLHTLCGYVEVPNNVYENNNIEENLSVHGGVTFCDTGRAVEQIVVPVEHENLIGFDCSHSGDIIPGAPELSIEGATYKDINFVINECKKLARQVRELQR